MNNQHRTQNTIQSNKLNVERIFGCCCCSDYPFLLRFVVLLLLFVCLFVVVVVVVVCFLLFLFFAVGLIVCCGVGVGWVGGSTDHPCFSVVKSFNGML